MVFDHFEIKLKENKMNRATMEENMFKEISLEESRFLEGPFEEGEIKEAVWNYDGTKIRGPDGYSLKFFKICWPFIKNDVMLCFRDFHSGRCCQNQSLRLFWH